jgi:pyroglutamyl-peptidase
VRAGFIHVPWNTEDAPAGVASIPLADIARSVRRAIDITLDPDASEPRTSAGTVA